MATDKLPLHAKAGLIVWNGTTWIPVAADVDGKLEVTGGGGGGGGPVTIADGADVAEGAVADVAVTGNNSGTVSAKLRGLSKMVADVWDSVNHNLAVNITNTSIPATITGNVTVVQPTGTNLHTVLDSGVLTSITNALPAGSNVIGHVINDTGSTTAVTGNVTVVQPTGTNLHAVLDAGANVIGHVIADSGSTTAVTGNVTVVQPTGTNLHAVLDSGTLTAVTSITNQVDVNQKQVGGTNIVTGGVAGSQSVGGPTAAGASLTANPLTIGALARTSPPTAVSNAQVVNAQSSIYGEHIIRLSLRETKGNQNTTITSSTGETTIVTADATYKLDLYGLVLTNTSGTGTKVTIKDSTAGTTRFIIYVPPNDTRGFMLPSCDGHKQNAANNNWTATCGTSVADLVVTAMFVQNL